MKKLKTIMTTPFLLGAQGFVAGAFFIWASPAPAEASPQAPTAAVAQVSTAS